MRNDRGGPRENMAGERGLSLVEASIILATLATLSAVLAPSISNYLADARNARATHDVAAIGAALAQMLADVGETFVLADGNGAAATDPPSRASSNRVDLLVTGGQIPGVVVPRSTGTPDWNAAVNNANVQRLDYHLALNTPSGLAANRYRTPADMSVLANFDPASGATVNSPHAWRGSYLPGAVGPDPWGYRYSVNVEFLARAPGGPSGHVNDVVVVSAGANGRISVRFDTDGVVQADDDVVHALSSGTR